MPRFREFHSLGVSFEKSNAEFALESGNVRTERRLGNGERLRSVSNPHLRCHSCCSLKSP